MEIPGVIAPLAPTHTGLTTSSRPNLYWYLSGPWNGPMYFSLNRTQAEEPLLEVELLPPEDTGQFAAGFHSLSLAGRDITLKAGEEYEWFVYLVLDPVERSSDWLASATLEYRPAPQRLSQDLAAAVDEAYRVYAAHGYWYDAIDTLNRSIAANPGAQTLRLHRAALHEQVKMPRVAMYDR